MSADPVQAEGRDAVRVAVRVVPGASRDEVVGAMDAPGGARLRVRVAAPPEDGRANDAVRALLARALGVRSSGVEIVVGQSSRDKVVRVVGVGEAAAREALLPGGAP